MTRMTMTCSGDLRCTARHEKSGETLATDAPTDNHGLGATFSPTDLVATALLTCIPTVMEIKARALGFELTGGRGEVEKTMSADAPRRISRLELTYHFPASVPTEHRALLERVGRACPVEKSLHPDLEVDLTFHWDA